MINDEVLGIAAVVDEALLAERFDGFVGGGTGKSARDQALRELAGAEVAAIQLFEGLEPGCLRIVLDFPDDRLTLPQPHSRPRPDDAPA
jgi:hypothetical protein